MQASPARGRNKFEGRVMTLGNTERRHRILYLPAWYPSPANPVLGTFIKEHAMAAALYDEVVVLYVYPAQSGNAGCPQSNSDEIEEGIRTLRVSYGSRARQLETAALQRIRRRDPTAPAGHLGGILTAPFRVLRSILKSLLYYWRVFATFSTLVNAGWKPDVIHAHVFTAGVPAVLLGWLHHLPVIVTEHSSVFPRRRLRIHDRLMAKFAMEHSTLVCPVSSSLRQSIQAYGIKAKFRIMPNVVDTNVFFPGGHAAIAQEGKRRLLCVALLTPKKGVHHLLEALACLRRKRDDFLLDIVGDGPQREEYEQLARSLSLTDIVTFHGMKDKSRVAELMRNSDAFVIPSLVETFSVVAAEALATGLPVVATRCGGPEELVPEEGGFILDPDDPRALSDGIEYVLDNAGSFSRARIAQYAAKRFSRDVVGAQLHEVYTQLARR